jgi:hypothetical protein
VARNLIIALTASALLPLLATAAFAAEGVGEAVSVTDVARASGDAGERALATGADVFVGDLVVTDATGEAQIRFSDNTKMVVGNNSSLVIDQALFRSQSAENRFAVRALGGAFRFISGKSGDKRFSIRTPSATIGVRGTSFDIFVAPGAAGQPGVTKVLLYEGEVTMCSEEDENDCETIVTPCGLLQTDEDNKVQKAEKGSEEGTAEEFPYSGQDDDLDEDFRIAGAPCLLGGLSSHALNTVLPATAASAGFASLAASVLFISQGDSSITTTTNTNQ